jgi:hypothetical protein
VKQRYEKRYFCGINNPDQIRPWFVIDRKYGVPVMDDGGIRYFSKEDVEQFCKAQLDANLD